MIELLQQLVRIPSVTGEEATVQRFYCDYLKNHGISAELLEPTAIPGFDRHPARLPEISMANRPNVIARIPGRGQGCSLLIMAHADTVPVGDLSAWDDNPFSGKIAGGKLYGRGSGDDKAGMAIAATVAMECRNLKGDLIIASVADEEGGGANGSAALLASGIRADAVLYLDGSNQMIWTAGLGGGFAEIITSDPDVARAVILQTKAKIKHKLDAHPHFGPAFFSIIAKQFYSITEMQGRLTFFHDTLPGEDEEEIKKNLVVQLPSASIRWMSRFLKPALLPEDHPLPRELAVAFEKATGRPALTGPGLQSDQGIIMHYGNMPCVLFGCGRRGLPGAPHLPNEYILLNELEENFGTVLNFTRNWCGTL